MKALGWHLKKYDFEIRVFLLVLVWFLVKGLFSVCFGYLIFSLLSSSWGIVGKWLHLSESQFPPLWNENNYAPYLVTPTIRSLWEQKEFLSSKSLSQWPPCEDAQYKTVINKDMFPVQQPQPPWRDEPSSAIVPNLLGELNNQPLAGWIWNLLHR